jgi:hypothetical protein
MLDPLRVFLRIWLPTMSFNQVNDIKCKVRTSYFFLPELQVAIGFKLRYRDYVLVQLQQSKGRNASIWLTHPLSKFNYIILAQKDSHVVQEADMQGDFQELGNPSYIVPHTLARCALAR